jgi:hypothetical protein
VDWLTKRSWVKINEHGLSRYVTFQADGTFTERDVWAEDAETWEGRWEWDPDSQVLNLAIGDYRSRLDSHSLVWAHRSAPALNTVLRGTESCSSDPDWHFNQRLIPLALTFHEERL